MNWWKKWKENWPSQRPKHFQPTYKKALKLSSKNASCCFLSAPKHCSRICDYNCDKQNSADAIGIAKCDQNSLYCFFLSPSSFCDHKFTSSNPTKKLFKAKNENQFFKCVHLNVNFVDSLNMNEYWSKKITYRNKRFAHRIENVCFLVRTQRRFTSQRQVFFYSFAYWNLSEKYT